MNVLFISDYDANDPLSRSGVPFYLTKGLKSAGLDYRVLQVTDQRNLWQRLQSRGKQWLCRTGIWKGFYDSAYSRHTARSYRQCWEDVDFSAYDKVLSISPRTVAFLPAGIQPTLWIDNTLASFCLYPEMQGICKQSLQEGLQVERIAFKRAAKIVTASAWLKAELVKQYPFAAPKTFVVPRGANLPEWPLQQEVDLLLETRKKSTTLQLVHVVSGGWANDRKGSKMVVEVYSLLKKHLPVSLTIIGNIPAPEMQLLENEDITLCGRVNKESPEGFEKWKTLVGMAHYLFVPSKADGFGIVYAEAAALGVPSLALAVMGVTEAVQQGVTGWLLPVETSARQWVDFILEKWNNREAYAGLCASTRSWADRHFKWSENVCKVLD